MPISGLVVTFASAVAEHGETTETIRKIPEIEIGDAQAGKLAIVVDSASRQRDQEIWQTVRELPGVIDLAVAFVGFDEPNTTNQE